MMMLKHPPIAQTRTPIIAAAVERATRAIPPAWPLSATVAVNPYLGQSGEGLATAGARLARTAGAPITLPRAWFSARIADGRIGRAHLAAALAAAGRPANGAAVDALIAAARAPAPARPARVPTVADLAAAATGHDFPGLLAQRVGTWAASWFDTGAALWSAAPETDAFAAWRAYASHDLTADLNGMPGFSRFVSEAPATAGEAILRAVDRLGLPDDALETYFHALLMTLEGWAQVGRYKLWQAELGGTTSGAVVELLAIRLVWEEALHRAHGSAIRAGWMQAIAAHAAPVVPTEDQQIDAILQQAAERAAQAALDARLRAAPAPRKAAGERPAVQIAFCIDVRSEVFRRALEAEDPSIDTIGFAGFFGLAVAHHACGSDVAERRLPVLLNPALVTTADSPDAPQRRIAARAVRAWGRFRQAAVSSFAFVEAAAPAYGGKLVRDALRLGSDAPSPDPAPRLDPALDLASRVGAAKAILNAMGLRPPFARLVVLAGHGATVRNNAHATALDCGACGGHSGEVNARLLAGLLNDPAVRAGVAEAGVAIPEDTLFLGALHDTTTDAVTLFDGDHPARGHADDLRRLRGWLKAAGAATRAERALRLPGATGGDAVMRRSQDWAEVRPEWGLAGCSAFIAAPRSRTMGRDLGGRSFLHSYDWRHDEGFGVLELIVTAPVVVASWISLQYYGSSVSPDTFGGGNKLLHNPVGGIGVLEGNGALLRTGLPWQSVHDGTDLAHEPLRLSVVIEAPREALIDILERHPQVRALFDNGWLHLLTLDDAGQLAWRYAGNLTWEPFAPASTPAAAA
jgi:uncharacterized protein YbcC (UPF0753/DUF2309 family)